MCPPQKRQIWVWFPLFFQAKSYQWLKNWHFVATLPGTWRYRVNTETSWPGVSILWLGEIESLINNFHLWVAAGTLVWADPTLRYTGLLLGHSATINQPFSLQKSSDTKACTCLYLSLSRYIPFSFQNGSGTKACTCLYLSTTKPKVGNWQLP